MNHLKNKMYSNIKSKLDYQKYNINNSLSFETFKDHWKQVLLIFSRTLVEDKDIVTVKFNLDQMINILLNELNSLVAISLKSTSNEPTSSTSTMNQSFFSFIPAIEQQQEPNDVLNAYYGPIWEYLLKNNIFEVIFLWSLSYPEYLCDLKNEQLKYYENLLNHLHLNDQTNLLLFKQLHRPLFSLLNHCSTHNSEQIEAQMIEILNQLCVAICKNSNLLNIFFEHQQQEQEKLEHEELILNKKNMKNAKHNQKQASSTPTSSNHLRPNANTSTPSLINGEARRTTATSKFFIFTLLIPYIHKEGSFGQQARDALLMIMQLSSRNVNLAKYIVECTDFCPILATGLSGLYSELPQKLTPDENVHEIRYLQKEDIIRITALNKFINSLEFCNNVIQVSHCLIANKLLQFVYYGFLVPVIAPALTQNCVDEIIAATSYLDLFLRTINEPNLLKIFLKFILYSKFDERITLLETLINRINSNSKLCIITLMLFYTMIDLNSEDVMYKLILSYLIPCKHLSEINFEKLDQSSSGEINGTNAQFLLSLSTDFSYFDGNNNNSSRNSFNENRKTNFLANLNESSLIYKWLSLSFEKNELNTIITYLDSIRFNFVDYLKDAKNGIMHTVKKSSKWSSNYELNTYTLMNEMFNSKSSCMESIKENEIKSDQRVKRPSQELDYDPEEFLLNLDLFNSSFNESAPKSSRSTMNLFSKEQNLDETQSVDGYYDEDDDDYDENDDDYLSSANDRDSLSSNSQKPMRIPIKRNHMKTDDLFNNSILSNKSDSKTKSIENEENSGIDTNNKKKVTKKKLISKEESLKRDKKRERRQKRRDRAADFYVLSFDNELSETSSSESDSSSSKEEISNTEKNNVSNEEDDDLTATSVSSTTTLNNDSKKCTNNTNNFKSMQTELNEECRQMLVEYLFFNKENAKLYLESNLNNFLGALDNFFQLNENKIKNENKTNNDINLLCDQILNIYNDIFIFQQNNNNNNSNNRESKPVTTTSLTNFDSETNNSENNSNDIKRIEIENDVKPFDNLNKTPLKLTIFPSYINETSTELIDESTNNKHSITHIPIDPANSKETDIGPFLCAILNRLDHMLSNSLHVNFLITGLLARLAYYPQFLLRSFLLNHNLVVQPNIKSLFQMIGNVKFKIDNCAKTYDNFSLLYLKAKIFLVKRLIDSKCESKQSKNQSLSSPPQTQNVTSFTNNSNNPKKKSSKMDKFLSIFFKPLVDFSDSKKENQDEEETKEIEEEYNKSTTFSNTVASNDKMLDFQENHFNQLVNNGLLTPQIEIDLNDIRTKFSKPIESIQLKQFNNSLYDFSLVENEWEDMSTRNIAFSVVVYDEFIKELAAICQEHCVLT